MTPKRVVNSINVHGRDQVMLKVTVAEMQRDVIKQLGIDLTGSIGGGATVVNFNSTNTFTAFWADAEPVQLHRHLEIGQCTLRAMERAGVIRTLAEPTLTAISGESANFLAGGEFPIPGNYTCDPQPAAARYRCSSRSSAWPQFHASGAG
jgi:pilus assembly protein CpaC